jgi:hypothetical protein
MVPDRSQIEACGVRLPETCGFAFKEWAGVCTALAGGRQTLIVRKGGIAEGPRGFVPEHDVFWLYPTYVHQGEQGLRIDAGAREPREVTPLARSGAEPPGDVLLHALAVVESITFVAREEILGALDGLHVWTEETLARRFHYRRPGLWVLGVRVFVRGEPHVLTVTDEHAGCKTWVPLDPPRETAGCAAVLSDDAFARQHERLLAALG